MHWYLLIIDSIQAFQRIWKELLINNIDIQKLDITGRKILNQIKVFEALLYHQKSYEGERVLKIAKIMHRIFYYKILLIQQDDEWSYEKELINLTMDEDK